jgi:uncharacterized membrane protein YtjA (UPF0391 family)
MVDIAGEWVIKMIYVVFLIVLVVLMFIGMCKDDRQVKIH